MISSMATRELLAALAAQYQHATGVTVQAEAAGGVEVAKRIAAGEVWDVVVLAANAIDKLIADGAVLAGARGPGAFGRGDRGARGCARDHPVDHCR